MKKLFLVALFSFLPFASQAADPSLPKDVADFIERRDVCDHFRGEFTGTGGIRDQEVVPEMDKYCTGTDKELSALRRDYSGNSIIFKTLAKYEDEIEASSFEDPQ